MATFLLVLKILALVAGVLGPLLHPAVRSKLRSAVWPAK